MEGINMYLPKAHRELQKQKKIEEEKQKSREGPLWAWKFHQTQLQYPFLKFK